MEQNKILDTNLLIEGARGLTTIFSLIEFPPACTACEVIVPNHEDYKRALELGVLLRKAGTPVAAVDILIASTALNRNLTIATKDKDFLQIKRIEGKLMLELVK